MHCRVEDVTPAIRVNPLVKTGEGYRIAQHANKAFLLTRICEMRREEHELNDHIRATETKLRKDLSTEDYLKVKRLCHLTEQDTFTKTRERQVFRS